MIGAWIMLGTFGLLALAFLICAAAMVEATRRQRTNTERAIGVLLVLVCILMCGVCGGVAWTSGGAALVQLVR